MKDSAHFIQKRTSIPDYSWLKGIAKKETETKFSEYINEKIRDHRNDEYDGEVHKFNRSTLADRLGMDLSTLTKIINKKQLTRKRDVIIAICSVLKMTETETNLALKLYPMAPLNRDNLRDLFIIQALHDKLPLETLNLILSNQGMPTLNLRRGDRKSETGEYYCSYESSAYEEEMVKITPYCLGDQSSNDSLHERYHPERYDFSGEMIVRNRKDPSVRYRIECERGGDYDIYLLSDEGEKHLYSENRLHQKYFHTQLCEDINLENEVSRLREYLERKFRYVHKMCGDTLYYRSRLTAENNHGLLVIYGESFGYDAPELCEYYQIELSSNRCEFTISDTSRFMEKYLGDKEWARLYGSVLSTPTKRFKSMTEITDARWQKHFTDLLDSARELLLQLKQKKLFIYNVRPWMDIEMLMHSYGVEEAFDCFQADEDLQFMLIPRKNEIIGSDGKPITVDDLWRAAELGISSVDELCAIRSQYGSLEQFLQMDILTDLQSH